MFEDYRSKSSNEQEIVRSEENELQLNKQIEAELAFYRHACVVGLVVVRLKAGIF